MLEKTSAQKKTQASERQAFFRQVLREREAFDRLEPQLLATHAGKYLAIYQDRVVGSADDWLTLAKEVRARLGNVPVCIRRVGEPRRVIRLPSPRRVRKEK